MIPGSFSLSVLTAKKRIFEGTAVSLVVPAAQGKLGILAHHAPLAAVLVSGDIVVKNNAEPLVFHSSGKGFLHVLDNKVEILLEDQAEILI